MALTHKLSYIPKRWTQAPVSALSPSFSVYILLLFILFLIIFCLIPVHAIIGFLNGIHNLYGIGYPLTTSDKGQISKVGRFIPQPFQLTGKFAFGYMLEQYYKFISAKAVHMVCAIESHQKTSNGTKSCISCQMPFRVIDYLQPIHINKDNSRHNYAPASTATLHHCRHSRY